MNEWRKYLQHKTESSDKELWEFKGRKLLLTEHSSYSITIGYII